MRKQRLLKRVAIGVLAAGLAGCSAASNTLEAVTEQRPAPGPATSERVVVGSAALGREITYGDVITRREGLLLHAQVTLENQSKHTVNFEYRWEWTDAEGFQLGDALSSWEPGAINGKERKLMTGVGPGPAAANFRLYIRAPGG
jgi:uncharacterized protein YcfL